ncbi:MAG: prepilin-type N-terminal cleavage/methylation domain-containing protein [Solirubrobacteraceae bacterium]
MRDQRGLTLIEVLASLLLLVIGLLGVFGTLSGSADSIVASQRSAVMAQAGQQALQAAEATPYADLSDSSAPIQTSTTNTANPTYYLSSCTAGACSKYQWDPSNSSDVESIDINTSAGEVKPLTIEALPAPNKTGCTSISTTNCQIVVSVYVFVTDSQDSICSQSGVTCASATSYKRLTVAVTNDGPGPPKHPIYFSTFVSNNVGGSNDPLNGANSSSSPTTCLDGGTTVACTH